MNLVHLLGVHAESLRRVAKSAKPPPVSVSDEAVKNATGKSWPEWIRRLNRAGAK